VTFGVQLWMYATPIVYPISQIPPELAVDYVFNPMAAVIEAFRYAFIGAGSINPLQLAWSAAA